MAPKSPRSSVSSTSDHARALNKIGRSFAGSKTAIRSSVSTSSINTRSGRNRAHSAVAVAGRFGKLASTSSMTYGVVSRTQPDAGARQKTSREAPRSEPQAASNTLLSRNTLTLLGCHEIAAFPLRLRRSTRSIAPAGTSVAWANHWPVLAAGRREKAAVPASGRWEVHRRLFRFQQVYSYRQYTPSTTARLPSGKAGSRNYPATRQFYGASPRNSNNAFVSAASATGRHFQCNRTSDGVQGRASSKKCRPRS